VKAFVPIFASLLCCFHFSTALAADVSQFVPSNPPEMIRLRDTNSPAHQAAKNFRRGVNLGNYLESPKNASWGVTVSPEEFQIMKRQGFDHVRIPVRWSDYLETTGGYGVGLRPLQVDNQQSTSSIQPPANAATAASPQPAVQNPQPGGAAPSKIQPIPPKNSAGGNPKSNVQHPAGPAQKPPGSGRNLQQTAALTQTSGATPHPASTLQNTSGGDPPPQTRPKGEAYSWSTDRFHIESGIFARADFAISNALNAGLSVILNIHDFDAFTSDPSGQTEKFLNIWLIVSAHYARYPDTLAFELLNEPKDAATTKVINPIFLQAIGVIRERNPTRTIFVGPGMWNQASELKNLVLPANDNNLIVTVHCYQPFYFTHQGATWAGPDVKPLKDIQFPGPPAQPLVLDPKLHLHPWVTNWIYRYNTLPTGQNPSSPLAFEKDLRLARQWSDYYGRPVHIGEFGAYTKAEQESRARFYAAFREECDTNKLGWAIWDWSAGFRYWDKSKGQPVPGMHEALFGR
jgi:endoglucanase